jgi:hypothetical protein
VDRISDRIKRRDFLAVRLVLVPDKPIHIHIDYVFFLNQPQNICVDMRKPLGFVYMFALRYLDLALDPFAFSFL